MNSAVNDTISNSIMSDEMSDCDSSQDSHGFEDELLMTHGGDDVSAQLAASGPVGVAAAAAIASGKKRKRPHAFETNPSIRKRHQTRLIRKLKNTIDEYTTRVGQQAVVLVCNPGKPNPVFKVFGASPLENVIRNLRSVVVQELEQALAQHAPPPPTEDPSLHELPPLVLDGIPTPVDKMTQAQLRAFIPMMLKYSTGRGKPGWGRPSTRPVWWPDDLPWANVRSDVRTEEEKQRVPWTQALRTIVKNCYKHHGREDLLIEFKEEGIDRGNHQPHHMPSTAHQVTHYSPTMVQTINNPDGTVSIIQVDPGTTMVTLPDGTQAQVQTYSQIQHGSQVEAPQAVQTLADVAAATQHGVAVDLSHHNGVTISEDGQLILSGEALTADPNTGVVTIPVSMYQTVVSHMGHLGEGQIVPVCMPIVTTAGNTNATSSQRQICSAMKRELIVD